jgi:hypothetical protein
MQRLGNQLFADAGAVRICRIDEVDTQLHSATKNANSLGMIAWWSPNSFTGNSHRAESEAMNAKVIANSELPRVGGR